VPVYRPASVISEDRVCLGLLETIRNWASSRDYFRIADPAARNPWPPLLYRVTPICFICVASSVNVRCGYPLGADHIQMSQA
jgi:hypothetical protein